ncbi:unnamed protein product [Diamesa tonsa]
MDKMTGLCKLIIVASVTIVFAISLFAIISYKNDKSVADAKENVELTQSVPEKISFIGELASEQATYAVNGLNTASKTVNLFTKDHGKKVVDELKTSFNTVVTSAKNEGKIIVDKIKAAGNNVVSYAKEQGRIIVDDIKIAGKKIVISAKDQGKHIINVLTNGGEAEALTNDQTKNVVPKPNSPGSFFSRPMKYI